MAGKANRHNTNMGMIGDMDYVSELIDVVASGQNIWQMKTMDTLTQADNTPVNTTLKIDGDHMTGTFGISAWCTTTGSLHQLTASTETLDVGIDKMHSSRWVWVAGSSTVDKLSKIDNDEFDGQLLFIENVETQTPTIYDESQQSGRGGDAVAGANIKTLDGSNFVFPSNKIIVCLMYSVIDSQWHMVTAGSASGANTTLSNLGTTSINADLLPQSSKDLGSSDDRWAETHTSDFHLYSDEHSGAGFSITKYARIYFKDGAGAGAEHWIPLYN